MNNSNDVLQAAQDFVVAEFNHRNNGKQLYHNLDHTVSVVKAAESIAAGAQLSAEETEEVVLAAWFHDVGFMGNGEGHEAVSAAIAASFLQEQAYPQARIEKVKTAIMATQMPQSPQNTMEQVLCDADLHYVGTKSYVDISDLLRTEWEFLMAKVYTNEDWVASQIDFLTTHKFHTPFAQLEFSKRKSKNITRLNEQLKTLRASRSTEQTKEAARQNKLSKQREKERRPDRGIETMFRVTNRNHMELSAMADNKANIMISINALIISIVISAMVPKLDKNLWLVIPTFVLLSTCLVTIIFATLSTRPKVSGGTFTPDDLKHRRVNLLFFGNFFKMKFDDFNDGMNEMMQDKDFLYSSMVKDIYSLGQVLGRKYRLVRTSYNVFMYGLILSVLAFAMSFALWSGATDF
ncbi:MAG: Pycsar system effector family protein [Bacteroidota bacterium]